MPVRQLSGAPERAVCCGAGVATIFAAVSMIGGIFGMNMPLPKKLQVSETAFIWVTFYTCFTGFVMFVGFVVFARWKRLLFIPSAGLGDR